MPNKKKQTRATQKSRRSPGASRQGNASKNSTSTEFAGTQTPAPPAPAAPMFFHVFVRDGKNAKEARNIDLDDLLQMFAIPMRLNKPFRVDGFEFHPTRIARFKVTMSHTRYDAMRMLSKIDMTGLQTLVTSALRAGQEQLDDEVDVTDKVLEIADQTIQERGLQPARGDVFDRLVQEDKVFLVTSFAPELSENFDAIRDACKEWKLRLIRVDKEMRSSSIVDRIQTHLKEANFVVADLTGARPNVYYEIGYFDAVCEARRIDGGSRLLLVAKNVDEAHFDIRHRGIVSYRNPYDLMQTVKKWLTDIIGASGRQT